MVTEKLLDETCSNSRACRYDYVVTGDRSFASTTKQAESLAQSIRSELKASEIRCPALDKPTNGRKSEIRNFVGKAVRFTCNEGYRLYGHEFRQCKEYGLWSWGEDVLCVNTKAYAGRLALYNLVVIIPVILLICCCGYCCLRNRNKKTEGKTYVTNEKGSDAQMLSEKESSVDSASPVGRQVSRPPRTPLDPPPTVFEEQHKKGGDRSHLDSHGPSFKSGGGVDADW